MFENIMISLRFSHFFCKFVKIYICIYICMTSYVYMLQASLLIIYKHSHISMEINIAHKSVPKKQITVIYIIIYISMVVWLIIWITYLIDPLSCSVIINSGMEDGANPRDCSVWEMTIEGRLVQLSLWF